MPLTRKALALSVGLTAILSAATIAQPQKPGQADSQLIIDEATVDYIQKSDISALREGVIEKLELKSGEGLWMMPFRGIPESGLLFPLDLLYLDEECQVIDVVESYPTFRASTEKHQPTSVLALPAHQLVYADEVGQAHLRLRFKSGDGAIVNGIAFRSVGQKLGNALVANRGQQMHVAGSLSVDRYQGAERVQFRVIDVALPDQGPSVIR